MSRLIFLLSLFAATSARAEQINFDPETTVIFSGHIEGETRTSAAKIVALVSQGVSPINLILDSTGGVMDVAVEIMNLILTAKARGTAFHCLVPTTAQSAAFLIFSLCDVRFALPYARLMWHSVWRMSERLTQDSARRLAFELRMWDDLAANVIIPALGVTEQFYYRHKRWETVWTAEALNQRAPGFLTIVTDVPSLFGNNKGGSSGTRTLPSSN